MERDVVYARQTHRGATGQSRQFAAIALGQVALGCADLLFDQIEIVEQPFAGWSQAAVCRDRGGQQIADTDQRAFVIGQARQKLVGATSFG